MTSIINRIRELRKARRWTIQQLADAVQSSVPTVQRLERGDVPIVHHLVEPIAAALGVAPIDLLASPAGTPMGLAESATPFAPPPHHALARMPLGEHEAMFQMRGTDMTGVGIGDGDILIFDVGRTAVRDVQSGDVVVAQVYGSAMTDATTVIRQYIAPAILITNSLDRPPVGINMGLADAAIKGVARRRFGAVTSGRSRNGSQ